MEYYQTSTMNETVRAYLEVRAIMDATGATKVTREGGNVYLNDSKEPWDGKTPVKKKKEKRRDDYDLYLF